MTHIIGAMRHCATLLKLWVIGGSSADTLNRSHEATVCHQSWGWVIGGSSADSLNRSHEALCGYG